MNDTSDLYQIPRDPVPEEYFGKDHWSTFAYIETRCVDHRGVIDKNHMRCDTKRHPLFGHRGGDASGVPTRLVGGKNIHRHDDWDCADDLEAADMIENVGTGAQRVYRMTKHGKEVASDLRMHLAEGFAMSRFRDPVAEEEEEAA